MAEQNQNNNNNNNNNDDLKYRKIFVGGLAWKTTTEDLKNYFEQKFGPVLHANVVVSYDQNRGVSRSKGYGFVVFRDVASATMACSESEKFPIIHGREANVNLACDKSHKTNNTKQGQPNQNGVSHQAGPSNQNHQANQNGVSQQAGPSNQNHQANQNGVSQQAGPSHQYHHGPLHQARPWNQYQYQPVPLDPSAAPYEYQAIPFPFSCWYPNWNMYGYPSYPYPNLMPMFPYAPPHGPSENVWPPFAAAPSAITGDVVHEDNEEEAVTEPAKSDADQENSNDPEVEIMSEADNDVKSDTDQEVEVEKEKA